MGTAPEPDKKRTASVDVIKITHNSPSMRDYIFHPCNSLRHTDYSLHFFLLYIFWTPTSRYFVLTYTARLLLATVCMCEKDKHQGSLSCTCPIPRHNIHVLSLGISKWYTVCSVLGRWCLVLVLGTGGLPAWPSGLRAANMPKPWPTPSLTPTPITPFYNSLDSRKQNLP